MTRATHERRPYTLADAYRNISADAEPWVALNEFIHEWSDYADGQRAELIAEPLPIPMGASSGASESATWPWAVFCAATGDWLCKQSGIERPAWVADPVYTLGVPWYCFDAPGIAKPHVRDHLERTTPAPFRRRNIICGDRVFATKYAFAKTQSTK
jgi:hypothetical protein